MSRIITLKPSLNHFEIRKEATLDQAEIGVYFGWILPIWAAHEELFATQIVTGRWNGTSDMEAHIMVALGDAEDVGDKFQLRISWEHAQYPGVVPATSNDVDVETTILAGRAAQYDQYRVHFAIDYNIDGGGNEIMPHTLMGMRLRRIAASANEVDNDPIILGWHAHYLTDKMFSPDVI